MFIPGRRLQIALLMSVVMRGISVGSAQTDSATASRDSTPPRPEQAADCSKTAKEMVFKDLPNLGRYAAMNATLAPSTSKQRRVVFMGDSITEFWATVDPDFFARADFVDRGISAQTTLQMLLRFRQDVVELKPAVVHIMAGVNDIAGNTGPIDLPGIEANIASMVDLARANSIQVVIASVLPAAKFPWQPNLQPGPTIAALNTWLRQYAQHRHLIYVDYYAVVSDGTLGMRAELSADGVHPSLEGYRLMDGLAQRAVSAAQRRASEVHPSPERAPRTPRSTRSQANSPTH